jgi:hypothetical protein
MYSVFDASLSCVGKIPPKDHVDMRYYFKVWNQRSHKSDLRNLISDVVEEKLAKYSDPDYGLELRPELVERLVRQKEAVRLGERGIGLDELLTKLKIDKSEIEAEEDVQATVS